METTLARRTAFPEAMFCSSVRIEHTGAGRVIHRQARL
jgi:hypothetical protein